MSLPVIILVVLLFGGAAALKARALFAAPLRSRVNLKLPEPGLQATRDTKLHLSGWEWEALNATFVDSLATSLRLSPATKKVLTDGDLSYNLLVSVAANELRDVFAIDSKDALKLCFWSSEVKKITEEDEMKQARLDKLNRAKSVNIWNPWHKPNGRFEGHTIVVANDLRDILTYAHSSGLALVDSKEDAAAATTDSNSGVLRRMETLINGSYYTYSETPVDVVQALRQEIAESEKAFAEFNVRNLLMKHFGAELTYRGSDVNLTLSKQSELGDIDSLFSTPQGRIVLLERKGALSLNSSDALMEQIASTTKAFHESLRQKNPAMMALLHDVDLRNVVVTNAVYCKQGPDELFSRLQRNGIFVIKKGADLLVPTKDGLDHQASH